jgi:HlyD family secretion protein
VVTELDVKPGDTVSAGQVLARMDGAAVADEVNAARSSVDSATDALTRATSSGTCVTPAGWHSPQPSPSASPSPTAPASPPASSPGSTPSGSTSPGPGHGSGSAGGGAHGPTGGQAGRAGGRGAAGGSAGSGGDSRSGRAGGGSGCDSASGRWSGSDGLLSAQQQLANANLALTLAQDKFAGTTITAPVAGKVLSVGGTVGAQQSPGSTGFIVLGGVTDTAVTARFSEADVARLAVGQPATVTLPNQDGKEIKGRVSQIDPAGTVSGRLVTYGVTIGFDQPAADLLLGQSANVAVVTSSATDVLYLPSTAVRGTTVTIRSGGQDRKRTVRVGLRGDRYTEVTSGLREGDEVVVG